MQTLYYNGDIIPMTGKTDTVESLVVSGGKIEFTGPLKEAEKLCTKDTICRNLEGRTLLPAFLDGHSHFSTYARFVDFADLSGCRNFGEIAEKLRKYHLERKIGADGVIIGTGYDHNFLEEGTHPDRELLDAVSEEVPVYLYHTSGHMGVANTCLLELAGLSERQKDPAGGRYGRDESGRLNGYLEEIPALGPVLQKAFERVRADKEKQIRQVQEIYLKYGITTVQDGGCTTENLEELETYAENRQLKLDVVAYALVQEHPEKLRKGWQDASEAYRDHLRIAGGKILLDGSPQGRTAWLSRPYEGEADYRGYPSFPDEVVEQAAEDAIRNRYQLLAHCNGDEAAAQYIRCYKKALEKLGASGEDLRPVMIHCQTIREDQLREMERLSMIPSIFVAHTYYWGDVHLKNLGRERGSRISPVQSAMKYGLPYNFHMDCPVLKPDVMEAVWCAVNRITRNGTVIGGEQRIDVYDALKGVTVYAAYAYHEENRKGTLERGKQADLVILEKNPLTVDPRTLRDIAVCETIKEGQTLYRK